ncbi:MAG TPA: trypsin-like peptidase domain-containing protein [Gaiellaceae bacterium]|jgi:S1-C subfamily serine protease|nr:trypsin-like peptidase domain-containing protein [Gaiellaceae bacterium]
MRPGAVAAVSLVAALVGGLGALAVGDATGWLDDTQTVVLDRGDDAGGTSEPARVDLDTKAKALSGNEFDPARIYAARVEGVVTIFAVFGSEESPSSSQGSGFLVTDDGLVLTNSHVVTTAGDGNLEGKVDEARTVYVQYPDGDRVDADVVGWDPFTDVAVLRVDPADHPVAPVPLGDSGRVVVGEPVAAIGSPFGNASSLAVGVVSATGRSVDSLTSRYSVVDAIQIDAPINRGNSGGPLFDARGTVVGVNAQIRSESGRNEGVGFAIPINAAKRSLEQLVATGTVSYAFVGIQSTDITPSIAEELDLPVRRGALVTNVDPDTPAEKAGIRAGTEEVEVNGLTLAVGGDLIVGIDGRPVRGADDVVRYVTDDLDPGDVTVFTVIRDGRRTRVPVTLGARRLP